MDRTGLPELSVESKPKFHRKVVVATERPRVWRKQCLDGQQAAVWRIWRKKYVGNKKKACMDE